MGTTVTRNMSLKEVDVDLESNAKPANDWFHKDLASKASMVAKSHQGVMSAEEHANFEAAVASVSSSKLVIPNKPMGGGFLRRQGWLLPLLSVPSVHDCAALPRCVIRDR